MSLFESLMYYTRFLIHRFVANSSLIKAIAVALLIENKFLLCQVQLCSAYYVSDDQGECTWIYKVAAWIGMLDIKDSYPRFLCNNNFNFKGSFCRRFIDKFVFVSSPIEEIFVN